MADTPELGTVALLALILVSACDSTSPPSDRLLQVQGEVLEAGQAPAPPLHVDIQAWPALDSDGANLRTDAVGRYTAELGPFPEEVADSLRVRVTQYDCEGHVETELWRRDLGAGESDALVLPMLTLSYRLPVAGFGLGAEMCGAIVTRIATAPELVDDHARLALWIDDVSDSVRGRWRLNHLVSIGDDYGYFSGSEESDRLVLQLRPTPPTPCTGLQLDIPFSGDNSSRLGPGELTGDCFVPNTTVRFFHGAVLPEVLPPNVGSETPYEPTPARLIGEFAGQAGNEFETYNLFLAVDQVDDSVRGLWSMSFQATCATHDGPVSGTLVGDQLQLRLRPDEDYEATLDLWLRVSPGDTVLSGRPILVEPGSVPGYGGPALCGSDEFDPVVLHQGEVEGMPIGR